MNEELIKAFAGGLMIGAAALVMLLCNGRILGVSGIVGGLLKKSEESKEWRILFLLGILVGGITILILQPSAFRFTISRSPWAFIVAGLLVGYGTSVGGGCTSGHGVCGIGRFSIRSLAATLVFMATGAITVFVINHVFGGGL